MPGRMRSAYSSYAASVTSRIAAWSAAATSRITNSLTWRLALHEGEACAAAPGVVEAIEAQLAAAGVVPEAEHVAAAEVTNPGLVHEHDRPLALRLGMRDAEV